MAYNPTAHFIKPRLVYGYFHKDQLVYIGSSSITVEELEVNHRECMTRFPADKDNMSRFRIALTSTDLADGYFRVLKTWDCTLPQIEELEGKAIRALRPKYNKDMYPVQSSIENKRY